MGIRSDVAVALKKNVWDSLSKQSKKTLEEWFIEPASETEEGHVLFFVERIKWYRDYEDLAQLYAELRRVFDDDDYLIIQACHDYPGSEEGNVGEWYENPWEIYKNCEVSIEWDEPQAYLHDPPVTPTLPTPNREGT